MRTSPIPVYFQIAQSLHRRIMEGQYEATGGKLEPEENIADQFGVSRMTVRQAFDVLLDDGIIERRKGVGSFVLRSGTGIVGHALRGSIEDLYATSNEVISSHITTVSVEHDVEFSDFIRRRVGPDVKIGTVVRRIRWLGDRPAGLLINHLPEPFGRGLTAEILRTRGVVRALADLGSWIVHSHQILRAEHAEPEVAEALGLASGSAVLASERTSVNEAGAILDVAQTWFRGDSYVYVVDYS